jgi:hypothetical protein
MSKPPTNKRCLSRATAAIRRGWGKDAPRRRMREPERFLAQAILGQTYDDIHKLPEVIGVLVGDCWQIKASVDRLQRRLKDARENVQAARAAEQWCRAQTGTGVRLKDAASLSGLSPDEILEAIFRGSGKALLDFIRGKSNAICPLCGKRERG